MLIVKSYSVQQSADVVDEVGILSITCAQWRVKQLILELKINYSNVLIYCL